MGPALRRYAVLIGWREPLSDEPEITTNSEITRVRAFTAQQAIETALAVAPRPSPLAEVSSIHLLSPAEEAEIAEMTAS
jgi:hypothetical protein